MTYHHFSKDLIVLVADKNMEFALKGILSRLKDMEMRDIQYDIYVHPERDPGCFLRCHSFLISFLKQHAHALVLLDHEGSGRESQTLKDMEKDICKRLSQSGWEDRADAVVIDPELEMWVWSDSPYVDSILGWGNRHPTLREWLQKNKYVQTGKIKPERPKEAMEKVLKEVKKPRSSSLYLQIAKTVNLQKCTDRSFIKLRTALQRWFG